MTPLTDLLCTDSYSWTLNAQAAFENLKGCLSSTPVLALPDFSQPFQVETDASGKGIKAVLSQKGHPVAYFSQKLCPRMQQASTYVREMLSITQAVSKWRQYLLGRRFIIIIDQQALKNLTNQVIQTPEQQKWLCKLVGYDFEIVYHPGKHNLAADELSRVPDISLMALSSQSFQLFDILRLNNTENPELLSIQLRIQNPAAYPGYLYRGGLLFFKGCLVLPTDSSLRLHLFHEFHSSLVGGHLGIARTFHCLSSNFYWKNMRHDVKVFIASC